MKNQNRSTTNDRFFTYSRLLQHLWNRLYAS